LNKEFDLQFMESLVSNPEWATQFTNHELVEKTGSQGIELLMWLAMRASLATGQGHGVRKVHSHYHIPISNTAAGLIALEKF
jgi:protocatechuate 4,5-dioxygenase beta chain